MVGNKSDNNVADKIKNLSSIEDIIFISAKNNLHIDALKKALVKKAVHGNINNEATIVTNARHFNALKKLDSSLVEIQTGLKHQVTGDLLSSDIKNALYYLGEITGEITNEDQLDYIFSKFCIGK